MNILQQYSLLQRSILQSTQKYYSYKQIDNCINYVMKKYPNVSKKMITKVLMSYYFTFSPIRIMYNDIFLLKKAFIENIPPLPETLSNLEKYGIHLINYDNVNLYSYFDPSKKLKGDFEKFICMGAATIKLFNEETLEKYQKEFLHTLKSFPEYRRDPHDPNLDGNGNPISYVLGGFAAFGNPGSFHNPLSRRLRKIGFAAIKNFMKENISRVYPDNISKPTIIQALSDRMMYRMKGQRPVAEAWHRDVMNPERITPTDEIYGGWINLDSKDQYFSFIPGSHLSETQYYLKEGFATLEKESQRKYKSNGVPFTAETYKEILKLTNSLKYKLVIPPGHMVIFPQYIMHEVVANPAEYNMMRQFTGWRLTNIKKPIYPMNMFDDQAVIPLPGGMIPPMYAQNHIMYFQEKQTTIHSGVKYNLIEWSEATFKPECLEKNKKGNLLVHRHMRSLKDYGFKMYENYSPSEKSIYIGEEIYDPTDEFILSEEDYSEDIIEEEEDTTSMHKEIVGLYYFKNAVQPSLGKELLEWFKSDYFIDRLQKVKGINSQKASENARKVVQFGYEYDYTSRHATKKIEDFPLIISRLRDIIPLVWRSAPPTITKKLNQCLINRYLPGQGISPHIDKVEFGDTIVCFTFLSGREMVFISPEDKKEYSVYTEPFSMYVMTKDARYIYKHAMKARKKDGKIPRGECISVTFREVVL